MALSTTLRNLVRVCLGAAEFCWPLPVFRLAFELLLLLLACPLPSFLLRTAADDQKLLIHASWCCGFSSCASGSKWEPGRGWVL